LGKVGERQRAFLAPMRCAVATPRANDQASARAMLRRPAGHRLLRGGIGNVAGDGDAAEFATPRTRPPRGAGEHRHLAPAAASAPARSRRPSPEPPPSPLPPDLHVQPLPSCRKGRQEMMGRARGGATKRASTLSAAIACRDGRARAASRRRREDLGCGWRETARLYEIATRRTTARSDSAAPRSRQDASSGGRMGGQEGSTQARQHHCDRT